MVVTMNYRLGPFGFLSMGSEDVPGNAGFRDQVLALERIQELIGIFFLDCVRIAHLVHPFLMFEMGQEVVGLSPVVTNFFFHLLSFKRISTSGRN